MTRSTAGAPASASEPRLLVVLCWAALGVLSLRVGIKLATVWFNLGSLLPLAALLAAATLAFVRLGVRKGISRHSAPAASALAAPDSLRIAPICLAPRAPPARRLGALGARLLPFRPLRKPTQGRPRWFLGASVWCGAGLLLVVLGGRSGAWRLAGYGWLLLVPGTWGLLSGRRLPARLWPAVLLGLLAVPHPEVLTYDGIAACKTLVGESSARLLALCGLPTELHGWVLRSAGREVRLVDACSGARTQIGLLVVVTGLICLRPASRGCRLTMLLCSVPAAFCASVLRTCSVVACYATGDASGWADAVHDVLGVLGIVPGVLLILGLRWLFTTFEAQAQTSAPPAWTPPAGPPPRRRGPRSLALVGLLAGAVGSCFVASPAAPPPPPLPARLGGLQGQRTPAQDELAARLPADQLELRQYGRSAAELSQVLLLSYQRLDVPHSLFSHGPEVCLRVDGWTVLRETSLFLGRHPVRRLEVACGKARRLVHYTYLDPRGRAGSSQLSAWLRAVGAGLCGAPNGGSLVLVSTGDLPSLDTRVVAREAARTQELLDCLAGDS